MAIVVDQEMGVLQFCVNKMTLQTTLESSMAAV